MKGATPATRVQIMQIQAARRQRWSLEPTCPYHTASGLPIRDPDNVRRRAEYEARKALAITRGVRTGFIERVA